MIKKGQIVAIAVALVLTVVIYNSARTPDDSTLETKELPATEEEVATAAENPLDAKVEEAVQIIQSGSGQPMQAIGLLREVIQVDSNHIGANYWLGEFSIMSGQYEKAIERFNKITRLQPDNVEFCIKQAQAYDGAGQTAKGVEVLNAFLDAHPNEEIKKQVTPVLNKLSVKL